MLPDKSKCSIDLVKVTTTTKISPGDNLPVVPNYKNISPQRNSRYLLNKTTGNIVVVTPVYGKSKYHPTLTVKFFSSWLHPLKYEEVVTVLNFLTKRYHVGWSLAEFHVALDFYFRREATTLLKNRVAARKSRGPVEDERYAQMYHFHGKRAAFRQEVYNKSQQLFDRFAREQEKPEWLRRTILDDAALEELVEYNVVRAESRFTNTELQLVPSLIALASWDFSFIHPTYLSVMAPNYPKLAKYGIGPRDCKGMSLAEMRRLFKDRGISNPLNYLKDSAMNQIIKDTLAAFRWCSDPGAYPLITPSLRMRDQRVRFVSKRGWWK